MPAEARSRVSSYDWFGSLLFSPAGFVVAGVVASAVGSRTALLIAACWFVTAGVTLAALPSIRAVRND